MEGLLYYYTALLLCGVYVLLPFCYIVILITYNIGIYNISITHVYHLIRAMAHEYPRTVVFKNNFLGHIIQSSPHPHQLVHHGCGRNDMHSPYSITDQLRHPSNLTLTQYDIFHTRI